MTASVHAAPLPEERGTESPKLLDKYLAHIGQDELFMHAEEIGLSGYTHVIRR